MLTASCQNSLERHTPAVLHSLQGIMESHYNNFYSSSHGHHESALRQLLQQEPLDDDGDKHDRRGAKGFGAVVWAREPPTLRYTKNLSINHLATTVWSAHVAFPRGSP